MFYIYQIILSIFLIISPIILILRIFNKKEDKIRFKEKFSFVSKKKKAGKLIWFHGASVGELMSIVPIIKYYEKQKSISQILVTTSTLSSSKVIKKFNFKKTIHQFYPIDHFFFTKKFIEFWKPNLAIFIESEIWSCMYKNLEMKKIPLILINARLTKKTFNRWLKISNFSKSIFNKITIAYPQNRETKNFLKKLNLKKINSIGNLKFTQNPDEKFDEVNKKLKIEFKKKKVWVASSTHQNEELFCAKTHLELKKKYKNLLTIIIPRHVDRVKEISRELKNLNLNVTLHSSKLKNLDNVDIYLVDSFGETKKFHKIASSVFLGGSIIKRGGQNPLEAARFGAKIFHGPNVDNFKDVYKLLGTLKISKKIYAPKKLASSIIFKKNKKMGSKIKNIGEKILQKTINEIDKFIKDEFKKT